MKNTEEYYKLRKEGLKKKNENSKRIANRVTKNFGEAIKALGRT